MNVAIYIDGVRMTLDNSQAATFALTFTLSERETPNSISGSRSKRFVNFPADSVNTAFFEYWHDATKKGGKGVDIRPARVEYNGVPVFSGVAQLEEVVLGYGSSARNPTMFRVSFFGNNATWFELLGNTQIRSLGLLPRHINSKAVIEDKVNTDNDPDTTSWGYTLIRMTDWLTPTVLRWQELTPFIYITQIIKQAFEDIGYKIVSDTFDTYFFKRLILPCPFVKYPDIDLVTNSMQVGDLTNTTPINPSTLTQITLTGDWGSIYQYFGGYDLVTGIFTVTTQGFYWIEVFDDDANLVFNRIAINSVMQPTLTDVPADFVFVDGTDRVRGRYYLDVGDTVELYASSRPPNSQLMGEGLLIVRPDADQDYDPLLETFAMDFSQYGNPDWKVGAMILDLTVMFNLIWDTDYDKQVVRVECRDEAELFTGRSADVPETIPGYYNAGNIVDWTEKVDTSKQAEHIAMNATPLLYELAYLSDSRDANIKSLDGSDQLKVYDAQQEFSDARYRRGVNRVTTKFFSKTIHVREPSYFSSGVDPVYVPAMQAELFGTVQTKRTEFAPRILFHEGIEFTGPEGIEIQIIDPVGSFPVDQALPLSWFVPYNEARSEYDAPAQSLAFGDEIENQLGILNIIPGMIRKFHWASVSRLAEGRKVKEWIFLTPADILNLSFRTRVLLFNKLYIVETIDGYVPGRSGSTQVVLIADNLLPLSFDIKFSGIPGRIPFT